MPAKGVRARRTPPPDEPPAGVPEPGGLGHVLAALLEPGVDPADLRSRDVVLMRTLAPALWAFCERYFRVQAEGLEHIPTGGSYIAVGNHGGAPLLPDVCTLCAWWAVHVGVDHPTYIMVHDFPFRVPLVGNLLARIGALPACRENAERVLDSGANLLCFPGGEFDCQRSFRDRNRVDLLGRTGFVELAFTYGVPIVPFVNVGGHEVYFTLFSSRALARWSGLEHFARIKTVPLIAGLPWGLWLTSFVPYLPLPAKFVYRVGAPIHVEHDPERARDRDAVGRVYRRVTGVMQDMMDDLARRRRFPVLG
jgi:1-acyl-sn-glycerol-3-phosphate acyltransferase